MTDPEFTRRTLMRAGVIISTGSLAFVQAPGASASTTAKTSGRAAPGLAGFRSAVGSTFRVRDLQGLTRSLRLVDVRAVPMTASVPGKGETFSLAFQDSSAERMRSATYRLRHPDLGAIDLMLQPVGTGRLYEAVVNRWQPLH